MLSCDFCSLNLPEKSSLGARELGIFRWILFGVIGLMVGFFFEYLVVFELAIMGNFWGSKSTLTSRPDRLKMSDLYFETNGLLAPKAQRLTWSSVRVFESRNLVTTGSWSPATLFC